MSALLWFFVSLTASAEINVLVDSPRERRTLVEVTDAERLSYRLCRGSHVTVDTLLNHCRRLGPDLPNTPAVRAELRLEFTRALSDSLVVYAYETSLKTVGVHILRDSLVYTGIQLAFIGMFRGRRPAGEWFERGATAYVAWILGNTVVDGGTAWSRRRHLSALVDIQGQVARADGRPAVLMTDRGLWPRPSTEMQLLANAMRHALVITNGEAIVEGD